MAFGGVAWLVLTENPGRHGTDPGRHGTGASVSVAWKAGRSAMRAAPGMVEPLISIDETTTESDLDAMLDRATPRYRKQIESGYREAIKTAKKYPGRPKSTVTNTGVLAATPDKAYLLVLVTEGVPQPNGKPAGYTRPWRVVLERSGDTWRLDHLGEYPPEETPAGSLNWAGAGGKAALAGAGRCVRRILVKGAMPADDESRARLACTTGELRTTLESGLDPSGFNAFNEPKVTVEGLTTALSSTSGNRATALVEAAVTLNDPDNTSLPDARHIYRIELTRTASGWLPSQMKYGG